MSSSLPAISQPASPEDIARIAPGVIAPVSTWLRVEELAVVVLSLAMYHHYRFGWVWYVVLFLVPDLSMLGYIWGPRVGAVFYNIVHSYAGPVILLLFGLTRGLTGQAFCLRIALIWVGHIALDRVLGYGLKYPTAFGHTHFGGVGKKVR